METQELRTLRLLEEIDKKNSPSQRDLAKSLNISLGLANSFVKRLAAKGYFKITNIPRNRVRYILTPHGAAEKTRLTYQYIQYSLSFYKTARQKLADMFKHFGRAGVRTIIFYGSTELAEIAYLSLQETGIRLVAVADSHKIGKTFFEVDVISPERIGELSFDKILITVVDEDRDRVIESLLRKDIPYRKIAFLE
jgi:DNA-binding MarR family transcriptional regulator